MTDDDVLRLREADRDDADEGTRAAPSRSVGAPRKLVVTVSQGHYPTVNNAFYAVQEVEAMGEEREGGPATLTPVGPVFYAYNHGPNVPPVGTYREATRVPHRWTFWY